MIPLIFSPIVGLLLFLGLRQLKNKIIIYCALLLITFICVYSIFFTDLKFTSNLFRDILLILFFASSTAALLQRGFQQRAIATIFLLAILLKGPLFGVYYPSTFDISKSVILKKFDFEKYSLELVQTRQGALNDIYHWKGKKYVFGNIFYEGLRVSDSIKTMDKCIEKLYISRIVNYEKGTTTLEKIINYDTCKNTVVEIERL